MVMSKPYVAYYRVSTEKQGINGYGMDAQKADVQHYIDSNSGELIDQYIEVESGAKTNRIEVWKAIEVCKKIKATLVIAKLDRLGRNVSFISSLMESGVDFIACDMPNASRFELHIRAAVAEEERRMISQRVKDGLAAAKRRGVKLGGYRGALKKHNNNKISKSIEFAESVRPHFELLFNKEMSQREIAHHLNIFGIKTSQGNEWSNVQVGRVIRQLNLHKKHASNLG